METIKLKLRVADELHELEIDSSLPIDEIVRKANEFLENKNIGYMPKIVKISEKNFSDDRK